MAMRRPRVEIPAWLHPFMQYLYNKPIFSREPDNVLTDMKRLLLFIVAASFMVSLQAQQVTAPEPEFINSYCLLTSDSTFDALPKEDGMISKHKNKFGTFAKIAGAASKLGFAGGIIGASTGNLSGLTTGLRVMGTATGVGEAADAVNTLAGAEGMDIAFAGGKSAYTVKDASNGVRLLIKGENNNYDPLEVYRIVRFCSSKKDRRIQWMEFKPALIGSSDVKKRGYIAFTGHKYGNQSYLLEIPASEAEPGEYGIFYMSIITATAIPVGTFSIAKL